MALLEAALVAARSSFSAIPSIRSSHVRSIQSITVVSKRRFSGCSGPDIEDSGGFRSTQKKTRLADSFLHGFRKKGLAVTDTTGTEWCEKQMEFVLLHGKRKVSKAMKTVSALHAKLEEEEVNEKASRGASRGRKRVKRESILGPVVDNGVAHEDVGLKQAILVPKDMPMIKKKNPLLRITIAQKVVNNKNKDDSTTKDAELPETESSVINPFATPEELERGKLPPEEILSLPMFKNYTAGTPTPVLYIKNLAKDIVADDFYYIFGSLFGSVDAAKSGLSVKLMQEGRMRGQAFVTFP